MLFLLIIDIFCGMLYIDKDLRDCRNASIQENVARNLHVKCIGNAIEQKQSIAMKVKTNNVI